MQARISRSCVLPLLSLLAAACAPAEEAEEDAEEGAIAEALEDARLAAGPVCSGAEPGPRLLVYRDADGDGFGSERRVSCEPARGYVRTRGDCDDRDRRVHPGAADAAGDGRDQDCGGSEGQDPHVGLSSSSRSSLQEALDAASPGTIVWVGPGTYLEHDLRFHGKAVRLASTHLAEATIIDAERLGRVFVLDAGETQETVIDGLTLTRGSTLGDGGGGAMLVEGAGAQVIDSILTESSAWTGGGLHLDGSTVTLSYSRVSGNRADFTGGGISATSSTLRVDDSAVTGNRSTFGTGGGMHLGDTLVALTRSALAENRAERAGGLFAEDSTLRFSDCEIAENRAGSDIEGQGGGIFLRRSRGELTRCAFTGNRSTPEFGNQGGAILLDRSSPALINCAITDNVVRGEGAGLWVTASSPVLVNTVIARNEAIGPGAPPGAIAVGAGIHVVHVAGAASRPRIFNTILAYNHGEGAHNLFSTDPAGSAPVIEYSDLYNPPGQPNHNLARVPPSTQTVEPGFLAYDADGLPADLHLALGSPLVNAGLPFLPDTDGSRGDLGIYGGPLGGLWDRDRDGYRDWFWPGSFLDAPPGVSRGRYDRDDDDPAVH